MAGLKTSRFGRIYQFLNWGLILFLSSGIGYVALLATKMRLSGDDYCLDAVLLQEGLWGMVMRSYLEISTYNGNRYSQIFFSGLAGLSPRWGNGYLVVGSLLVWMAGLTLLARWISQRLRLNLKFVDVLVIALSYTCLVLWSTQRLEQSVIWRSAMTAYFMPMVALTGLLLLILFTTSRTSQKWWQFIAVFLTGLIAAGFSETGAAYQASSLGLMILVVFFLVKGKSSKKAYLLPMFVALLGVFTGVALMYFSPVTAMRRSSLPDSNAAHEMLALLALNIRVYIWQLVMRRTLTWVVPLLFGIGLGLVHFVVQSNDRNQTIANLTWKHWTSLMVVLPVMTLFLVACVMLPATYVQASYPPERVLILAQSVITMAAMLGGTLSVLWLTSIIDLAKVRAIWFQYLLQGLAVVLVLLILVSPILLIHQNESKHPFYTRWSQMWDLRHEELLQAGRMNVDQIHVIELDHVISDVGELSPDPEYWYNNCAEMYYGVKAIYADLPGW